MTQDSKRLQYKTFDTHISISLPLEFLSHDCDLSFLQVQDSPNKATLTVIQRSNIDIIPQMAIRTFFHPEHPARWSYGNTTYYVRRSHSISINEQNDIEIYYSDYSEELYYTFLQCLRLLIKRIGQVHGMAYLPCIAFPNVNIVLAGPEGCGRLDVLKLLSRHYNALPDFGVVLIEKNTEEFHVVPIGSSLSFSEFRTVSYCNRHVTCNETPHILYVQRWNSSDSICKAVPWEDLQTLLLRECHREYEFYGRSDYSSIVDDYKSLKLKTYKLLVGNKLDIIPSLINKLSSI